MRSCLLEEESCRARSSGSLLPRKNLTFFLLFTSLKAPLKVIFSFIFSLMIFWGPCFWFLGFFEKKGFLHAFGWRAQLHGLGTQRIHIARGRVREKMRLASTPHPPLSLFKFIKLLPNPTLKAKIKTHTIIWLFLPSLSLLFHFILMKNFHFKPF